MTENYFLVKDLKKKMIEFDDPPRWHVPHKISSVNLSYFLRVSLGFD